MPRIEPGSLEYKQFLRSRRWREIRRAKLRAVGGQCEWCRGVLRLQVHHLTYERLGGDELMEDLQVLCKECHRSTHRFSAEEERAQRNRREAARLPFRRRTAPE